MLSKNQMVAVRKAIEKTYVGVCTVTEKREIIEADCTSSFSDVVVLENQSCRLSFEKSGTVAGGSAGSVSQNVKLFISPDINITAGSRVTVLQNGEVFNYTSSSKAAVYSTHKEIQLEIEEYA